jgi:AraC-like DNA-binding protein
METRLLQHPPTGLADWVRNGLVMAPPDDRYVLPAALSPLLVVTLSGAIRVLMEDGGWLAFPALCLSGPTRSFRVAQALPGTRILTVALQPGATRLFFGVSGRDMIDRFLALDDILSGARRGLVHELEACLAAPVSEDSQVQAVWDCLLRLWLAPLAAPDVRVPLELLGQSPAELASAWGVGLRQFERCFLDSYGQPLRAYRRQLRFSRLLGGFDGAPCSWADLAAESGYADQAHLIRDVRRFTGHSPASLLRSVRSGDPAFWAYRVAPTVRSLHFGPDGF